MTHPPKDTGKDTPRKDAPHIRVAELAALQQRVIKTIAAQSQVALGVRMEAQAALRRAVDKLVRLDADTALFDALSAAAWDAVGRGDLTARLKDAAARVAIAKLEQQHGSQQAIQQSGAKDFEKGIALKLEMDKLAAARDALDKRMTDVKTHNARHDTVTVDEPVEKKFKESNMFSRIDFGPREKEAYAVYAAYNKRWSDQYKTVDYFDDMRALRKLDGQIREQQSEIDKQHERYQARAAALYEMAAHRRNIDANRSGMDYATLVDMLCEKMKDDNFLSALSRHVPLAKSGPVMVAAVKAEALQYIEESLTATGAEAIDTLKVLEDEVLPLAQENKRLSAVEMAEEDARVLAGLAGYMCVSAAAAINALATFQPEDAESAHALRRDLRMHMAVAGKVDPAYISETLGMDQTTAGYFSIDRLAARPDIARVLADTSAVARADRRYAAFLTEMAGAAEMEGVGFGNVRLDSDAFSAIMDQTKPNLPAAQQFAEIARLSKAVITDAQQAYVRGLEPAAEQDDEAGKPRRKRRNDGPQP